jgi:hypothetical protein
MELMEIRKTILTAIAADDELVDVLVLKGGSALELIHKIGGRASVDPGFSLATEFEDVSDLERRLFKSLRDRFDSAGFVVFDETFGPRPPNRPQGSKWGGYSCEFKIISKEVSRGLGGDLERMRRQAQVIGPDHRRRFIIEISAFEYVDGKLPADVDDYTFFVYSVEMIAVERLRAICQQSPFHTLSEHPTARSRDFYDIFVAVNEGAVDFSQPGTQELVKEIFGAREVDLRLIEELEKDREFHRADWPSVEVAVDRELEPFDYYFDEVLIEVQPLKALWVV